MIVATSNLHVACWILPVYVFACVLAARWIFQTDQESVPPSMRSGVMAALRMAIVFVIGAALLTDFLGLSPPVAAGTLFALTLVATKANIQIPPGDGYIEIFLWSVFVMPMFLVKEFVFGFPVHKDLFLHPEVDRGVVNSLDHLVGNLAIVVNPLRPIGTIEISGHRYTATSLTGEYIKAGETVSVDSCSGGKLNVRVSNENRQQPDPGR